MTTPTVHLNGTSADELREGFIKAYRALGAALDALSKCYPNGRDYYPQDKPGEGGLAIARATAEHRERMDRVAAIQREMLALAEHVQFVRATKPRIPFNEADCGGVFDGNRVVSDADSGL